jgi:tetratricopeptide (TPR) repeat protein
MNEQEARQEFDKGVTAARNGHFYLAQTCLERAVELFPSLEAYSWLAYCRAGTHREYDQAIATVRQEMARQPDNPLHPLLLGRILILADRRQEALDVLRQATRLDAGGEIRQLLEEFGTRKPPVFPRLSRSNPINRICGLILSRLELR